MMKFIIGIMIIFILCLFFLVGCGLQSTEKPQPKKCIKVWNKADQRVVYECFDTLDGAR